MTFNPDLDDGASLPSMDLINTKGELITVAPTLMFEQPVLENPESGGIVIVVNDSEGKSVHVVRATNETVPRVTEFDIFDISDRKDGTQIASRGRHNGRTDVAVVMVPVDVKGSRWDVAITPRKQGTEAAELEVKSSPDLSLQVHEKTPHELRKGFDRLQRLKERIPKWGKKIIVAAGLYSTIASGGLIDKAIDPLNDAGAHVETLVDVPGAFDPSFEVDGIPFLDYPLDAQEDFRQQHQEYIDTAQRVESSVAKTMSELDSHQTEGIVERARVFEQQFSSELYGEEESEVIIDSIGSAETAEDAAKVFEEFLAFYNIKFEIDDDVFDRDEGVIKQYMMDSVRAISPLPRDILIYKFPQASFESMTSSDTRPQSVETLQFSTMASVNEDEPTGEGTVMAHYNSSNKKIVVGVPQKWAATYLDINDKITPRALGADGGLRTVLLHELGHAMFPSSNYYGPGSSHDENPNIMNTVPSFAVRDLLGIDQHQTPYGQAAGPEEDRAEAISKVIDVSSGVSHPDQTRDFTSEANEDRLRLLIQFEEKYPGITDYLVAQNEGLIGRQVFDIS